MVCNSEEYVVGDAVKESRSISALKNLGATPGWSLTIFLANR